MRLALLVPLALTLGAAVLPAQRPAQASSGAALVERAERLAAIDDDSMGVAADRALAALSAPGDLPLRVRAMRVKCWASAGTLDGDSLAALATRAMADAERVGNALALADLRVCRGYGLSQSGKSEQAAADFDAGVAYGRRLGNARLLADASLFRGEMRYDRGDFGGALADLKGAYDAYVRLGVAGRQRYTLNSIANVYADRRVGEYDRALQYYRQVLVADRAAGLTANVSTGLYNIGSTLESEGDFAAALPYYRQSLAMERQRGDSAEAAYVQQAIGVVLSKLGRHAEALRWLDGALAFFVRTHATDREPRARLSRAVALRGLGRPAEALRELAAAQPYFQRTGNTRYLEKVHDERAQDLAAAGDWAGAYRERAAQMALQEAMARQQKAEETSRLRVQFDSEKTEAENRALVRENALRGRALADAARIRRLQTAVLLLMLAVAAVLALLVARHVAAERRMRKLAMTDELTRLPNRRHLLALAHDGMQEARRASQALSVLALDVDHFKRINDTFGHEVGDEVLRRVAHACRAALRLGDSIGRTGGEEFAVVLPGTGLARATEVAERLRVGVEHLQWSDLAPGLTVTVSVGVAERAPDEDSFAAVVRRADDSLYRAKERGRNRVELAAV